MNLDVDFDEFNDEAFDSDHKKGNKKNQFNARRFGKARVSVTKT